VTAEFFRTWWVYRYIIVTAAVLATLVGILISRSRTAVYETAATIKLTASTDPAQPTTSEVIAMFQDPSVAERAIARGAGWHDSMSPEQFIREHLVVEPVPGSRLMRIRVSGSNAADVAHAANQLVDTVAEEFQRVDRERAARERSRLATLVDRTGALIDAELRRPETEPTGRGAAGRPRDGAGTDARRRAEQKAAERLYERLLEQSLHVKISEDGTAPFEVISRAVAPDRPLAVSMVQVAAFSAVTGFVAAILIVTLIVYSKVGAVRSGV